MTKPIPLPYSYLIPAYGHDHPMIDGLLIARELIEHHIPDSIQYEQYELDESHGDKRRWVREHNDYKDKVLAELDRRIEQIKIQINQNKT